ncbi:MAG: hypothetical protein BLM47_11090 [Candidatus Reconcilbacillus cellulovorans]|uniref:ATP-grasp domain-containing protein n=1 Tax=Candidatus Reconcilbacillus cellulovorans TaxID=1906605 RepID=A0A2A6DY90_9BACL|nr:MAG: hypothetical protein BLM47_11090 [Candidatus Reconcilbacillus cellulovorans]
MNGPYVGILLDSRVYRGIPKGKTGHEVLELYEKAAERYGVVPCYLRLDDLRPEVRAVKTYVRGRQGRYRRVAVPLPSVVHNRAATGSAQARRKLKRLASSGIILFNPKNGFGKWNVYRMLSKNASLAPHLPETHPATNASLRDMIRRHDSLILKPNRGSLGVGVVRLDAVDRAAGRWRASIAYGRRRIAIPFCSDGRLPGAVRQKIVRAFYLVQQRIPLAEPEGRPFDVRVSVQRGDDGAWRVTGVVGKWAAPGSYLTNVAQGAQVSSLDALLSKCRFDDPVAVERSVHALALSVAEQLGAEVPHLADLGLDIGVTKDGFPMLIECNTRDLRYSFKLAGMDREFTASYAHPIGYAAYLLSELALRNRSVSR